MPRVLHSATGIRDFKIANLSTFDILNIGGQIKTYQTETYDTCPVAKNLNYSDCEAVAGSGIAKFVISNIDTLLDSYTSGVIVSYHKILIDANAGINALKSPYASASTTIYARITNAAAFCYKISKVTLTVNNLPNVIIMGDSIVCGGTPIHLSFIGTYFGDAKFLSVSWSFLSAPDYKIASIDKTGILSGKEGGTATVKIGLQDTKGCVNETTKVITVTPTLKTISVNGAICSRDNATIKLTGLTANNSFRFVYHINNLPKFDTVKNIISDANGNAQFKAQLFSVNNKSLPANTQYLTIDRATDAFGCTVAFTKQVGITVYPLPIPNFSGDTSICSGNNFTLKSSYILQSGTSFNSDFWSSSNMNVVTVSNGYVTGISGGTADISYKVQDSRGCDSTFTKTITVTKSFPLTITGLKKSYCETENNIVLTGNPSGGNFTIDGVTSTSFKPSGLLKGNHLIQYNYTDSYGCKSFQNILVSVDSLGKNLANGGLGGAIKNRIFVLNGNTPNVGDSAVWTVLNNVAINFDNIHSPHATISGLAVGEKVVLRWTIFHGACNSFSDVTILPAELLRTSEYIIYPNPTDDYVTLQIRANYSGNLQIEIIDMIGHIFKNQIISFKEGLNTKDIPIDDLSIGIYLMILKNDLQEIKYKARFLKK